MWGGGKGGINDIGVGGALTLGGRGVLGGEGGGGSEAGSKQTPRSISPQAVEHASATIGRCLSVNRNAEHERLLHDHQLPSADGVRREL